MNFSMVFCLILLVLYCLGVHVRQSAHTMGTLPGTDGKVPSAIFFYYTRYFFITSYSTLCPEKK